MKEGGDYSSCKFVPFLEHQGSDSCRYWCCSSIPHCHYPFTSVPFLKLITCTIPGQWSLLLGAFSAATCTQASFCMPRHFLGEKEKKGEGFGKWGSDWMRQTWSSLQTQAVGAHFNMNVLNPGLSWGVNEWFLSALYLMLEQSSGEIGNGTARSL